jgi:hypothetical protein
MAVQAIEKAGNRDGNWAPSAPLVGARRAQGSGDPDAVRSGADQRLPARERRRKPLKSLKTAMETRAEG